MCCGQDPTAAHSADLLVEEAKAECRRRSEGVQKSRIFPAGGGGSPMLSDCSKKCAEKSIFAASRTLLARATLDFRRNDFLDEIV